MHLSHTSCLLIKRAEGNSVLTLCCFTRYYIHVCKMKQIIQVHQVSKQNLILNYFFGKEFISEGWCKGAIRRLWVLWPAGSQAPGCPQESCGAAGSPHLTTLLRMEKCDRTHTALGQKTKELLLFSLNEDTCGHRVGTLG